MSLEERLKAYKDKGERIVLEEETIKKTVGVSKEAFYEAEDKKCSSYFEFLFEQAHYIKKYWWFLQLLILLLFWAWMTKGNVDFQIQRNMGVLASVFVIIMVPELWKSRASGSMEIEGTTYYSLRQIYAARLCLFAIVDIFLILLFFVMVSFTTQVTIRELLLQFFLPFNVNCCICCRLLFSRRFSTEYIAVSACMIWAAVWSLLIWDNHMFETISLPFLGISLLFSILYLAFCVRRILARCDKFWEVNVTWSWF